MITYDQVTEVEPHKFTTEASTIGLRPGYWPNEIKTDMGNGQPLVPVSKLIRDGSTIYVRYNQLFGCIQVKIFND